MSRAPVGLICLSLFVCSLLPSLSNIHSARSLNLFSGASIAIHPSNQEETIYASKTTTTPTTRTPMTNEKETARDLWRSINASRRSITKAAACLRRLERQFILLLSGSLLDQELYARQQRVFQKAVVCVSCAFNNTDDVVAILIDAFETLKLSDGFQIAITKQRVL